MQQLKRVIKRLLFILVPLYFLLMIPDTCKPVIIKAWDQPFAWNQDSLWKSLEQDFAAAKKQNRLFTDSDINKLFAKANALYKTADTGKISSSVYHAILSNYFHLAALVAAGPGLRDSFINYYSRVRNLVKLQSQYSNITNRDTRNEIYQLLYGMRAAAEEVLLQTDSIPFDPVLLGKAESSVTPAAGIFGIEVHSGDLFLSRGGAEVSALISRGNNYPGNFSHVALLYVDEKTNVPYLVEAHIEKGVAVASAEQYIRDKKLRFMVLRPRADLPQLKADPLLPHKAAKTACTEALSRHIPYDFKMDFNDSTALFCSEVASHAYKKWVFNCGRQVQPFHRRAW
ncbi:MAG: hypothetical protein IPP72_22380 [Chitinophagaceae bacterium]|nr:hypothetical protein [Chitinophagaceae bacterium]